MKWFLHVLNISFLLVSGSVLAKSLNIPLKLESSFIEQIVKAQLFPGKSASLRLNDDGSGCQFVELAEPKVKTINKSLKVRLKTKVRVGRPVGNSQCIFLVKWNGIIDLYHDVKISSGGKKLHVVVRKSEILTQQLKRDHLADTIWQGIRNQLYPKFQSLVIDLQDPIDKLKGILPYVVAQQNAATFENSIDSLVVNDVNIKNYGVLLGMQVKIPNLVPVGKAPVDKLSASELALLEQKLNALDAFATFTIKQFLKPSLPENIRISLLGVLFDVRYEIVRILEAPDNYGPDPVRQLFLSTWRKVSPILRQISGKNNDQVIALQVLSFITASDALAAIDQYGPELGLDISVNGLRRLARLLNDDMSIDPIERDEQEDPQLRKLFGLNDEVVKSTNEVIESWLDFFIKPAYARVNLPAKLTDKLNNWVPKKKELNRYLPMVKKVLAAVSQAQLDKHKLDFEVRKIYRNLVYAAAWQESCWKQFANIKGFRRPVSSYSGDLGLMQINPRVWRGFYNIHKLKWDIVYNANTGAEILMHYMTRYVMKNREHIRTGNMDNLARATYSGYNGGPSQYTRYRKRNISGKLKQIDNAFYKKYKAVRDKGSMSVKSCYVGI